MRGRSDLARVAALAAGVLLMSCGRKPQETLPEPPAVKARVARVEAVAGRPRVELAGTVAAQKVADVSSRVMALVTAVHADLGDRVAAGQRLVSIDPTAAAGQVSQAEGGLAQAEAARALAERNFRRFEALAAKGAASALELDQARAAFAGAEGAVRAARGAIAAASSVAREARVVAPFAGRVAARQVEVGDLAAPGRPLLTIESAGGRRLILAVSESLLHAAGLKAGDTVPVRLDALPGAGEIAGTVAEISPGPDPVSHTFTVKIALPAIAGDGGADVPAGSAARAFLPGSPREQLLAPAAALLEQGGLVMVAVVGPDGRVASRAVTVGDRLPDGRVEILSGVAAGERLAVGLTAAPPFGARLVEVRP